MASAARGQGTSGSALQPALQHAPVGAASALASCPCCRRKQREAKRFSKEVQAERRKDKAQQRKAAITDVTKLRKLRQKSVRSCSDAHEAGGRWGTRLRVCSMIEP